MKALVKSKKEPGLWLEDVPKPGIGINDVLIRVHLTGICGTDLHIYDWDSWAQKNIPVPLVIGHEFVGEIVEVGSNVSDFKPGEIVSGEGHVVCGRCRNCLAGRRHLCAATKGVGVSRPGCFAEYISLPMTNIWRHGKSVPREVASIFDPFGNAVHTALSFPVLGEDVLITGAGPIGIMVNPKEQPLSEVQKKLGMQEGFDVGLEMSGNGAAFSEMLANMSHGAKIAILGIPSGDMAIDWTKVIFNMLTLKGIYGMTVMLESGLDITPVITHRLNYTEFEQGFTAMRSGNSGKVILNWLEL
jgi:threonine 3-dehydrogenase